MGDAKPKRIRRDPETTRRLILDTTERIMIEDGYAAANSRRIAHELGLNPATVHYYFKTTDDIFIALHRRMMERQLDELNAVLATAHPLQAMWKYQSDWGQSALGVEFVALAGHRKALQGVLAAFTSEIRAAQSRALAQAMARSVIDQTILPPVALTTILIAIARTLANEERVGITQGHQEVRAFVDWALARLTRPGG